MFGHTGLGMLICRNECVAPTHIYALNGMLTHDSGDAVVFPQRLPYCSSSSSGEAISITSRQFARVDIASAGAQDFQIVQWANSQSRALRVKVS